MSRDAFFERLSNVMAADAVRALEAFCTEPTGLSAYFTGTNKGDLRVRLIRAGRTIFTATYQTQNQQFLCRAYCIPATIAALGIPHERVDAPANPDEPQRSEFRLTPEEFSAHLLEVVLAAAVSFMLEHTA
ncbi:hypothetical protein [Novosphingobium aerophilum]|uniref:Uncharacterized protein n=1 Tax=Novosphingobium aerophilum TaxID=2839843 RepID=A0A7X1KDJ4_9SPHN|nr:hypothetical protein [Novosphingobium aerophilum]MBC2653391.1 hypothetical protein [Novosphingobium aerophilum]